MFGPKYNLAQIVFIACKPEHELRSSIVQVNEMCMSADNPHSIRDTIKYFFLRG
jgi:hypothetical protein